MREKVIAKIEELYTLLMRFIKSEMPLEHPFSLFDGIPGAAIFLYEYARFRPARKKQCYKVINTIIEKAFDHIQCTPRMKTSYCDGIIGILWLAQFFHNVGVIEMDQEDLPEEIIEQLSEFSVSETIHRNHCDLLHGGFGFWAFLLESKDLAHKAQLIREQLNALNSIRMDTGKGCNWKIDLDIFQQEQQEKISIDPYSSTHLGLAHGISFILVLLAKTKEQGFFKVETEELLHKGLSHIHSLKQQPSSSGYCYPMVVLNGRSQNGGRLAWCNGELCVALAFWMGWKATGTDIYKAEAFEIMERAGRKNRKEAGALDAGLCHGTAGIAQIFRRFYWETHDSTYAAISDRWISETLNMANYTDGLAGFKTYRSGTYGGPHAEYGFLSGIAGIGSVLLSSLSEMPSDWDRVLQLH
jgi:hypothetical protein